MADNVQRGHRSTQRGAGASIFLSAQYERRNVERCDAHGARIGDAEIAYSLSELNDLTLCRSSKAMYAGGCSALLGAWTYARVPILHWVIGFIPRHSEPRTIMYKNGSSHTQSRVQYIITSQSPFIPHPYPTYFQAFVVVRAVLPDRQIQSICLSAYNPVWTSPFSMSWRTWSGFG